MGQKGPFRGKFCSSLVAAGCGGIGPDRPRKGPGPEKAPICPEKARFSRKDLPPIFSENLGLKPPFVSPRLDFPNSRVLFSFLPRLLASPYLGTFSPSSPPRKVLSSVGQRPQCRAWRGAILGWISPQLGKEIPSRKLREKRSVVL